MDVFVKIRLDALRDEIGDKVEMGELDPREAQEMVDGLYDGYYWGCQDEYDGSGDR